MYYIVLLILTLALLGGGCKSLGDAHLVNRDYKVRIYAVDSENYPSEENSDLLPPLKIFPKLNLKQMKAVLSNLRFYNYNVFSDKAREVFYQDDVDYLAPRILRARNRMKKKQGFIIVYKNFPVGNLVRTSLRTTMLLWNDKQGVNIFIEEVRKPLISEDLVYQYSDWDKIEAIDIKNPRYGINLVAAPPYLRKDLDQLSHSTWLVLPLSALPSLTAKKIEAKKIKTKPEPEKESLKNEKANQKKEGSKAKPKN